MRRYAIATALCFFSLVSVAIGAESTFQIHPLSKPSANVNPGDVYGVVRYVLRDFRTENRINTLLEHLGSFLGDQEEGEYILTLEIRRPDDTVLAREALLQFKITEKKFLIFVTKSLDEMVKRRWQGDIVRDIVVRDDTNTYKVALVTYFSEKSTIDWSAFNGILKLANLAGAFTATLPATAAAKETWEQIQTLVGGILDNYKKTEVTDVFDMSFIKLGSFGNNGVELRTPFRTRKRTGDVFLNVSFLTTESKIGSFDVRKGQFTKPEVRPYIRNARVGTKSVEDFLRTDQKTEVREFLAALNSGEGYKEKSPGLNTLPARCNEVEEEIYENFSNRDAAAVFWAWLAIQENNIKKHASFDSCLKNASREVMTKLGLPNESLLKK